MTTIDLDALITALDPEGRGGRRHADEVAVAIRAQVPHLHAAEVPELVADTIRRGAAEGRWTHARNTTVLRGRTALPKTVTIPATRPPAGQLMPVGVPLRDELAAWAAVLRLSAAQRQLLLAVNDWLRRTSGGDVPVAAAAERAYELIGDEKAFDSTPPRGGAQLWRPGRLTFQLLRCERVPTPLTWEAVSATVPGTGPIVCVENHATFRTMLRFLRGQSRPPWAAVAWVQGRNTAPLESLPGLPFPVTRLDYLGDLDSAGLDIAATACATAETAGIPAGPAVLLWALLIEQSPRADRKIPGADARRLTAWLPAEIRERAAELLRSGQAIPQEALRYDVLAARFNGEPYARSIPCG
ncbi:MAG TPA: hypothetical protein VMU94_25655 [Streptosporangiaceae bacterium]|nr:hypothetical protein [Streptosporangiaceae bacterium]